MDPISALSLTANIFQVIGFAIDIVHVSLQIHDAGTLDMLQDLESAASKTRNAAKTLTAKSTRQASLQTKDPLDQELLEITDETLQIAGELDSLLQKVHGKDLGKSLSSTTCKTFRTVWNKDKVLKLQQRLHGAREELQFHLIVSIRNRLNEQSVRLDYAMRALDNDARAALARVIGNFSILQDQSDAILSQQTRSEVLARERHDELLATIGGPSRRGKNDRRFRNRSIEMSGDLVEMLSATRKERVQAAIVSSLWFPTMQDREDGISEAHKATYRWIYQDPKESFQQWHNFSRFLQSGSGVYWITGKPGAGKSTLMKFLAHNDATRKALNAWAGARRLTMARFYFYYNGSPMQKSQIGVLRSLLHQICSSRPELVRVGFKDRYEAMCLADEQPSTFTPTLWELKRALKAIIEHLAEECFFFAVDGLDEYDADSAEMALLAKVFKMLSGLAHVKSVLSSRPLVTFEQSFDDCPRLRLHELTRPDITAFVEASISQHLCLQGLMTKDPSATQSFVKEIVDGSSGVFLWVQLVVSSLLEGLRNGDEIDDLKRRLHELPTDLEALYRHMWDRIPSNYRSKASRLLRLVETATYEGGRISVLGTSFAVEPDEDAVFRCPVAPLTEDEMTSRYEAARVQISSRCMGLVEVSHLNFAPSPLNNGGAFNTDLYDNVLEYSKFKHPHVVFVHRTISEFIASPDIRNKLHHAAPDFSPTQALLCSAIHRIKTYMFQGAKPAGMPKSLESLVYYALFTAGQAESATKEAQSRLLVELDRAMTQHGEAYFPDHQGHWTDYLVEQGDVGVFENGSAALTASHNTFLSLAVRHGLVYFVRDRFTASPPATIEKEGRPLLDYALRPYTLNPRLHAFAMSRRPDLVEFLLEEGCDPNEKWKGSSLWRWFLKDLIRQSSSDSHFFQTTPAIIRYLLRRVSFENQNVSFHGQVLERFSTRVVSYNALGMFDEMTKDPDVFPFRPGNWLGFQAEMRDICSSMKTFQANSPSKGQVSVSGLRKISQPSAEATIIYTGHPEQLGKIELPVGVTGRKKDKKIVRLIRALLCNIV
ncbi:hypothetical protein FDECE_16457 [Fusarium decemcellulare]|nr:hypothetical protein FDECE_16457 [Fusarium decemcellulare]